MDEDPEPEQHREIWVQDLADRNLFRNRSLGLTLPESALGDRLNPVIKIMYDRSKDRELPFGYFWRVDDQAEIDPAEGDAVRLIFDLRDRGMSAEKIARQLEDLAHPRTGRPWHSSQIRKILENENTYRTGVQDSDSSLRLPPIIE
jgi:hypothetical protein